VPPRTVLLDTSFILALESKDDPHHQQARDLDSELLADHAVLLLHWGILLELADGYARVSRRIRAYSSSRNLKKRTRTGLPRSPTRYSGTR
jgi:predicted nucleic acid-binding protein